MRDAVRRPRGARPEERTTAQAPLRLSDPVNDVGGVLTFNLNYMGLNDRRVVSWESSGNTKGYSSAAFLGTRPNISESHSETSTRVPFCIGARRGASSARSQETKGGGGGWEGGRGGGSFEQQPQHTV